MKPVHPRKPRPFFVLERTVSEKWYLASRLGVGARAVLGANEPTTHCSVEAGLSTGSISLGQAAVFDQCSSGRPCRWLLVHQWCRNSMELIPFGQNAGTWFLNIHESMNTDYLGVFKVLFFHAPIRMRWFNVSILFNWVTVRLKLFRVTVDMMAFCTWCTRRVSVCASERSEREISNPDWKPLAPECFWSALSMCYSPGILVTDTPFAPHCLHSGLSSS